MFIKVGGFIGLWPTLAIVVLTAVIGTVLMRIQGIATLQKLQQSLEDGSNPATPMAHGALILVAGVLLLTPGFFTDAVGLAFLIPPVRSIVISWGAARFAAKATVFSSGFSAEQQRSDDIIEGEFVELPDDDAPRGASGWTKPPDT